MASQSLGEPPILPDLEELEGRIPFRVRIGVTGHRHLDDEAGVRTRVVERLAQVRGLFPRTDVTPVAFTVLTALAEGADRLVPRAAPDALRGADVEFEAVLPLTVEDYLGDFETATSRQEFKELLGDAAAQTALTQAKKLSGGERIAAYERAGRYIIDRSDVVIAVWDGGEPRGRGGTAEIIDYAHDQEVPVLVVPSTGPGAHELAFDRGSESPKGFKSTPRFKESLEAFHRIDEYNRSSVRDGRLRQELASARRWLARVFPDSSIDTELESVGDWVMPHFVRADLLSLRHHTRYTNLGRAIHFLAAFAVTAVAAQVVFARKTPAWLGSEIALLVLLIVAVRVGRRGRVRERWTGYRSLAEAFRCALFLGMTGAPDRERVDQADPLDFHEPWFQRAFSEAWRRRPTVTLEEEQAPDLRRFLVKAWIDGQIAFHDKTADAHQRRRAQYTWIVYVLAGITIAVATLHIADLPHGHGWSNAFMFIAITLPGFGAALTGLREHGQHRLHEERSRRTARRLQQLKAQLELRTDLASVRALAAETQRVIVEENLDWSGVIEFQDLEMVI